MRDEIEAHIAIGVDHLVASGMSRADAERQVRARFGDMSVRLPQMVASAQRRSRKAGQRERIRDFARDITFAVRQLRRSPALTFGVVLSVGFGIGATATVYSWMQGMVLRPFPAIRDAQDVISLRPPVQNGFGVSVDEFREWRAQMKSVNGVAAVSLSLFAAKIHPLTPAHTLTIDQVKRLTTSIKQVLRRALRHRGSTLRDYVDAEGGSGAFQKLHKVYDREGEPCRRCKRSIKRIVLGGRSTCFCPKCQGR